MKATILIMAMLSLSAAKTFAGSSKASAEKEEEVIVFTKKQWLSLSCLTENQKVSYFAHELSIGTASEEIYQTIAKFDQDCEESKSWVRTSADNIEDERGHTRRP